MCLILPHNSMMHQQLDDLQLKAYLAKLGFP
jgi:hypothetical protein